MVPGLYNLVLYRGDTRTLPFVFENDAEPPVAHDLTGLTFTAQIRDSYDAVEVRATFTCTVTNALAGEVEVVLPATEAAKLDQKTGVWDLQSVDVGGVTQTWVKGSVEVLFDVTRSV